MVEITETKLINDLEILSEVGFVDLTHIHKTKPYNIISIKTLNHYLKASEDHKVFAIGDIPIMIKNLEIGDTIKTKSGLETIQTIIKTDNKEAMYSPTVENVNSSYYSNGIQSGNSTTVSIYALHYSLFNKNKTVAILANKMQGAKEILTRIGDILEGLPVFLRPGIKTYNKTSMSFENGCKLIAAATTPSAVRGLTINCITGDNKVLLKNNETNEEFEITLENLVNELK